MRSPFDAAWRMPSWTRSRMSSALHLAHRGEDREHGSIDSALPSATLQELAHHGVGFASLTQPET